MVYRPSYRDEETNEVIQLNMWAYRFRYGGHTWEQLVFSNSEKDALQAESEHRRVLEEEGFEVTYGTISHRVAPRGNGNAVHRNRV